jgi:membrane-associated phospholipid phosphatase
MDGDLTGAVTDAVTAPSASRFSARTWLQIRRISLVVYVAFLAGVVYVDGVPTSRFQLMSLAVIALAIASLGRGWRAMVQLGLDWLPFTLALMLYDLSRGLATSVGMPLHEGDIVSWESTLFGGTIPTVWLQQHLYSPHTVHWYDALMTLVYTSHFLATPILAAVLWWRDRRVWISYTVRVVVLSVIGVLTYVLFPEAPPWLAARDGLIEPVSRLSARGWIWFHLPNVHELLENAQEGGSNPVAAMPSLHTAFATLVALFIAGRMASRWRALLALYPLAMGFALVYLGEHYVLDVVAGVGYALAVHWAVSVWEQGRQPAPEYAAPLTATADAMTATMTGPMPAGHEELDDSPAA